MNRSPRRLITGHNGFVGQHALQIWAHAVPLPNIGGCSLDIRDAESLAEAIAAISPHEVVHLAGISFVPTAIKNPRLTYEVNFLGTLNLLQALEKTGFTGRMLFVSSADPYGIVSLDQLPIREERVLAPRNPYAVSKAAAEALCYQWSLNSKFEILIARPFNHIGPGQSENFVISDFAKQIAEISAGKREPEIHVGNIDVSRDFSDVRDVLRAYDAILKHGKNSQIYNVCSEKEYVIRDLLKYLLKIAGVDASIINDATKWRSSDQPRVVGSAEKIRENTNWFPIYSLNETLSEIYQYWEKRIDN